MTTVPSREDFVRPVVGDDPTAATTPLNRLPVGDFAVLAWIDDVAAQWYSAEVEAELVARWNTATPDDVYDLLFAADSAEGPSS